MSKKLKTRLILVVVLFIWGSVTYRLFKNYTVENELEETQVTYNSNFNTPIFLKDSFDLLLPGSDPFLGTKSYSKPSNSNSYESNNSVNSNNNHKRIQPKEEVVEPKTWPQIKYLGFIKNHENTDALCLLKINGNMLKVSRGDQEAGVFISNVFRDSIHLVFSGEEKTFVKG